MRTATLAAVIVIAFALASLPVMAEGMTPARVVIFQGLHGGPAVGGAIGTYLGTPRETTRPTGIVDFLDAARDNAKLDIVAVGGHLGGGLSTTLISDIGPFSLGGAATTKDDSGYFGLYLDIEAYKLLVGNAPMDMKLSFSPVEGKAADGAMEKGWLFMVQGSLEFG